jgi:hypothetical protein
MSPPQEGPRDWDKELAQIDKLIAAGGGDIPESRMPAARRAEGAPAGRRAPDAGVASGVSPRRALMVTWVMFLLTTLLGVGLWRWPYAHSCGLGLYGYLGAVGTFGVASLWSTFWSWRTRSGLVHFLSIGLMGWAAVLGAREVLPRIGYAKHPATWQCTSPTPAQTAPPTHF